MFLYVNYNNYCIVNVQCTVVYDSKPEGEHKISIFVFTL